MQLEVRSILCVVVLFRPRLSVLSLVETLSNFGYLVVLVNNSCDQGLLHKFSKIPNVHILGDGHNVGLAMAINTGLHFAFETLSAQFTILFDQDSSPRARLPYDLAVELTQLTDERIASISPRIIDEKAPKAYCPTQHVFNHVSPGSVPTSGTLIPKDAWLNIGPMLNDLFIDGIDHEWCFRACSLDFNVVVSAEQTMVHNMGDAGFSLFGVYKPIHRSPFRHYFIVRNTVFLSSLSYIPIKWRSIELIKTVRRILVYAVISTNRPKTLRLMVKAVRDGLCKRLGPLDHIECTN